MPTDLTILDFWRWAYSDLLSNTTRGVVAEYLVTAALGHTSTARIEWDMADIRAYRGTFEIEVKSAAYVQSWQQHRPSRITFDIAKKLSWDAATNQSAAEPSRPAACYVFCVLAERDPDRVNLLDLVQWEFYVLSTQAIERAFGDQKRVALSRIQGLTSACPWTDLQPAVDAVLL